MRWILIVWLFVFGGPVLADRPFIPGEDAVEFSDALNAWLDGDDLVALQGFKGAAEGGNTAAQILLARIAEEPHMHRHVTGDMSRKDRIELLRQPGGLSGTSWLDVAQEQSALAEGLVLRKVAFTSEETNDGNRVAPEAMRAVELLLAYGEIELATEVAFKLYDGGFLREILSLLDKFDGQLNRIAILLKMSALIEMNAEKAEEIAVEFVGLFEAADMIELRRIHPQVLKDNSTVRDTVVLLAEQVEAWTPLRELCEISCPNTYNDCLVAGVTSIGVARRYPFSSPVESLVLTEDYWHSARIRGIPH